MKKFHKYLPFITTLLIASCNNSPDKADTSNDKPTTAQAAPTNQNDVEVAAVNTVGSVVKDAIDNKRKKDSTEKANKEQMWVYQLGIQIEDAEDAGKEYDKYNGISNIYILKGGKHAYYIIKDDGYSKDQLYDSLGSFKKRISSIQNRVTPVDLAQLCPGKKKPITGDAIKYKLDKEKKEAECRVCE